MEKSSNNIVIAGVGMLPVGRHWELSLRRLAAAAVRAALADAGGLRPDAIYIGNSLAGVLSHQANLGALVTDEAGFTGIESCTFEAAGASGAAAFRAACQAVGSGFVDVAVALGVEKVTEGDDTSALSAQDLMLNYEFEGAAGLTAAGQAALLARRYLLEYGLDDGIFREIVLHAYTRAAGNPNAMFRQGLTADVYKEERIENAPLGWYDIASLADGAAALVVTREDLVPDPVRSRRIRVLGTANAIAPLSLHDRKQLLHYSAAEQSAATALRKAGLSLRDVDLFELWDATVIDAALSAEAIGLVQSGKGWTADSFGSLGGCLGRGNPLGASSAYQLAETVLQLRGEAGGCQVHDNPKIALVQALGGLGATAVTHVLGVI